MFIEMPDLEKEVRWLKNLQQALSGASERKLTIEEWEKLLIIAPQFVVEPHSAQCGFNFGITLWHEANSIDGLKVLFTLGGEQLPEDMGRTFNSAWDALSPLSHCKTNENRLAHYRMNKPREKSFYDY